MFSQLFAPLVFMIFDNPSNRKLVFHRSHGITFNTFCACFFDFISSVIFDMIFSTFEAIFVSISRQKTIKNSSWKSLFFWLRKKSHRSCFLQFWTLFGVIFGSLLLDFRVPFFIVFYGGRRRRRAAPGTANGVCTAEATESRAHRAEPVQIFLCDVIDVFSRRERRGTLG